VASAASRLTPWPDRADRGKAARRQPLSPERIVATALALVDTEGLDALSMRRVAQELGTGAASLYAHVQNKDELIEQVLDLAYGELLLPVADPACWQEQLKDVLRASRAMFARHGDLARATLHTGMPVTPNGLDVAEAVLAVLRAGGLDEQTCAYAVDLLGAYVTAIAVEEAGRRQFGPAAEAAGGDGPAPAEADEFGARIRAFLDTLPTDRYPQITALAGALTRGESDERFEFGLEILVTGLVRRAGTAGQERGSVTG
jgi:AcrR family transcriptional regulator